MGWPDAYNYFTFGPANRASAQAYGLRPQPLLDAQVDGGSRKA